MSRAARYMVLIVDLDSDKSTRTYAASYSVEERQNQSGPYTEITLFPDDCVRKCKQADDLWMSAPEPGAMARYVFGGIDTTESEGAHDAETPASDKMAGHGGCRVEDDEGGG